METPWKRKSCGFNVLVGRLTRLAVDYLNIKKNVPT